MTGRPEYAVFAETKDGKTVIVRRDFTSLEAAEDCPVKLSNYRRAWAAPIAPRNSGEHLRPDSRRKPHDIESAFDAVEAAAAAGARCPMNEVGAVNSDTMGALVKAGRVKVEVFCLNWRVATILVGQHTGKRTQEPPHKHNGPYLTITKEGRMAKSRWAK